MISSLWKPNAWRRAIFVALLLAPTWVAAEDHRSIQFVNGQSRFGAMIGADPQGIVFQPEGGVPVRFLWEEIEESTLAALADAGYPVPPQYNLASRGPTPSGPATPGTISETLPAALQRIEGVEVVTADGKAIRGRLDAQFSTDDLLFVLTPQERMGPFPRKDVKIHSVSLSPEEAYPPDELYRNLMEMSHPRTADDHRMLGDQCISVGLREQALHHYQLSGLLRNRERPEGRVVESIEIVRRALSNAAIQQDLYDVGMHIANEEYDQALDRLNGTISRAEAPPAALENLRRIATEVSALRERTLAQRVVSSMETIGDALLRSWAMDRGLSFAEAFRTVSECAPGEIRRRVAEKFALSEDSVERLWTDRPSGAAMEAGYGDGTWLVEMPQSEGRETWWAEASNDRRYAFLRAAYAEKFGRVIQVGHKGCTACGGSGLRPEAGPYATDPSLDGTTACRTCRGLRQIRYVLYR